MIGLLPDLPPNVAGFKATGEVTKEDYEKVVYPEVRRQTALSNHLSFVFYVDTPLKNFSAGAWLRDIWLGMKGLAMWNRVAIISDVERIRAFTNTISHLLPGEYKGFPVERLQEAIRWAATEEKKVSTSTVPAYIEELLPAQTKGESTMTSAEVSAGRESDARFIFERASERLLDVNQWTDHCGALAAGFQLADDTGEPLEGRAAVGDYIRIDIPGPGPAEGKGYDWVRIEKIERRQVTAGMGGEEEIPATGKTTAAAETLSLLQVRPCAHPQTKDAAVTAHFLEDSATSTFIIEWEGKKVRATVFGRNEVPNSQDPAGVGDRVRNAVVGSLGAIGLSKVQWKALVQGLLEKE